MVVAAQQHSTRPASRTRARTGADDARSTATLSSSSSSSSASASASASASLSSVSTLSRWWTRTWTRNRGMILVLLGEMFGAGMAATTRLLEVDGVDGKPGMTTMQILFARFSITFVLSTLYMYVRRTPDFPFGAREVRGLLWLRGFCGFLGVYGFYYALRYLPLSEGIIIGFLAPLFTSFVTSYFLKLPFSILQGLAGAVAFLGVIIIADPLALSTRTFADPTSSTAAAARDLAVVPAVSAWHRFMAITLSLTSVCAATGAYTTIRIVGDRVHALIQVNYYAMVTMIGSALVLFLPIFPDVDFRLPQSTRELVLLIYIGVCGFLLQFLMTAGLQADKSSRATNMMYSQIIFALVLDWSIWGAVPGRTDAIGGVIVLGAVIWGSLIKEKVEGKVGKLADEEYAVVPGEDIELDSGGESEEETVKGRGDA